jgi:sporulation protein YlmC with PRC-barrel domain
MNKTTRIFIALASVFCLVLLGSSAFAGGYNEFTEGAVGATFQPMGWDSYEASWLIGHGVTTKEGGDLGQISSLVIDKTNGRIAVVVLSDVPGLGHELLPIPFSSIERTGQETFKFNSGDMEIGVALGPNYVGEDPYLYAVTRFPSYSEFYGLPSVMDVAWLTDIYRHYGQVPYWPEGEKSPMALELYESSRLMGSEVQLPDGEAGGRINDFVIDSSDGRVAFLVLDNVPGRETSLIAVPFSALSAYEENGFVLNTTRQQLAIASSFDEFADLNNPRWAGDVYRYFGVQPYWSEQGEMAPIAVEREGMDYQMDGF